jgi:hypothetical protein
MQTSFTTREQQREVQWIVRRERIANSPQFSTSLVQHHVSFDSHIIK